MIQAAFPRLPARGRLFFFFAAFLFLVAAQAGAVETIWQKENDFVRIEQADGVSQPSSLPKLSADAVRAVLAAVQVSGEGQTRPLFDPNQLAAISGPIAQALAEAGPGQDVTFAMHEVGGILDYLGPPHSTAGRIFLDGNTVGLILGMVHGTYLSSTFGVDPSRIRTGSRLTPQETEYRIVPGGAVSLVQSGRGDWARISPAAWTGTFGMPMASAPAPAVVPAPVVAAPDSPPAPVALPAAQPAPASLDAPVPRDPAQIEQRFAALKRLLDDHLITQQDYDRAKAELLKAMATPQP